MSSNPTPPTKFPNLCYIHSIDKEILESFINRGLSLNQIAAASGKSQTSVRYWLKKFDLKLKRSAKGKKPKDFLFPRKCSCGETDINKF